MTTIFFSYSHADRGLRDTLEKHLSTLKRQGYIDTWHDRCIQVGDELGTEIEQNLEEADVILLLVSADFLDSDYCYDREMKRAIEKHLAREARVIPVILRHCDWQDTPFGDIKATPEDGKPITAWSDIDEAFLDVVKSIKAALPGPNPTKVTRPTTAETSPPPADKSSAARSSNLRIRKQFSEANKDSFLEDAFNFMAQYFENSLSELASRNDEVTSKFKRIDANRFTAVIYRDGTAVSRCKIVLGGMLGRGITYSSNDQASDNSCNENLSVSFDDQNIYLEPMGMRFAGQERDAHLSLQGAAEYYWSILIEPIQ